MACIVAYIIVYYGNIIMNVSTHSVKLLNKQWQAVYYRQNNAESSAHSEQWMPVAVWQQADYLGISNLKNKNSSHAVGKGSFS